MADGVPVPRRASRLSLVALGGLLAAVGLVAASLAYSLAATVTPSTIVPVTLANGGGCTGACSTTLNGAATSATTATASLPLGGLTNREVLKVVHGSNAWSVQVRATALSGLLVTDGIVLTLTSGSSASLTLSTGSTLPLLSASVPLAGGGGATDVAVNVRGACALTCVLDLEFRISNGSAAYTYPYTLTVT